MRPIIGITVNILKPTETDIMREFAAPDQTMLLVAEDYIKSVYNAGGIPVLLPCDDNLERTYEIISRLDGVIISGGNDINPKKYHEPMSDKCGSVIGERDEFDIAVARYIIDQTNRPILGICRGCQILNVAFGGSLYQDLLSEGKKNHSIVNTKRSTPSHKVSFTKGSRIQEIFSKDCVKVNSYHHQAIKELASHWSCTGISDDGIIEAIEPDLCENRFILGVQWHPEMMYDNDVQQKIFKAFLKSC